MESSVSEKALLFSIFTVETSTIAFSKTTSDKNIHLIF
jgi:hypothetical protein